MIFFYFGEDTVFFWIWGDIFFHNLIKKCFTFAAKNKCSK